MAFFLFLFFFFSKLLFWPPSDPKRKKYCVYAKWIFEEDDVVKEWEEGVTGGLVRLLLLSVHVLGWYGGTRKRRHARYRFSFHSYLLLCRNFLFLLFLSVMSLNSTFSNIWFVDLTVLFCFVFYMCKCVSEFFFFSEKGTQWIKKNDLHLLQMLRCSILFIFFYSCFYLSYFYITYTERLWDLQIHVSEFILSCFLCYFMKEYSHIAPSYCFAIQVLCM